MALDLKLNLKLSQQLVMTPQLQQAIKLLQLNRMEMVEMINQELVENPVLEEGMEMSVEELEVEQRGKEKTETDTKKEEVDWEAEIDDWTSQYNQKTVASMKEVGDQLPSFESILSKTTSLVDHLLWQLSMASLTEQETNFGRLVIGNITNDGYLQANLADLAKETEMELEDAEEVLKILHQFDPIGCCSRDLKECLLTQAKLMEPRHPLLEKVIEDHLSDLEKKNYQNVAKALNLSVDEVIEITKLIMEFEPKPGRSFQSADTQYITPDIYVYKVGDEFAIVLNDEGLPRLRISPYYKSILQNKTIKNKDEKEYVQEKLRSALWLIRSIHNRQKTIYKVMEAITKRQRDFFDKGVEALKPMILKDVADDIGMHESTISRVTTNKFVHTPVGIFELKYFFNSSINASDGSASVASESVKQKIKQLVSKEDPKKPLSDQKLVALLKKDNIDIARRTVAKYREMLGILSSSKRKKMF